MISQPAVAALNREGGAALRARRVFSCPLPDLYEPRNSCQLSAGILLLNRPFSWHDTSNGYRENAGLGGGLAGA